jgi:hypothetical protein
LANSLTIKLSSNGCISSMSTKSTRRSTILALENVPHTWASLKECYGMISSTNIQTIMFRASNFIGCNYKWNCNSLKAGNCSSNLYCYIFST